MGGDKAPDEVVAGAILAERDFSDIQIIYVGQEDRIRESYARQAPDRPIPSILNASEIVDMGDKPVDALRTKPDNSILRAVELHKKDEVQAFVSAGNTGACAAAATLKLRMIEGVQRPGIACSFPSRSGSCLLLDCGANVNARPRHMLEYAVLGRAFRRHVHGLDEVRVGLLNIGEEAAKGNDFVKESHDLLSEHADAVGFVGNVEARDIFTGDVDVVVCEGFVGNSLLKGSEGLAKFLFEMIRDNVTRTPVSKLGGLLLKSSFGEIRKKADPNEFGGAPLLGVNGHVVISHGSSSAWGIRNAIRTARDMVSSDLNENIRQLL